MSYYRVCMVEPKPHSIINFKKFDNKEDAEHYAKNESVADNKHSYEVQKNNDGEFVKIKSYFKGQEQ